MYTIMRIVYDLKLYTCFKFRFSTLKWKSAIIGRVNGASGRVYNMQHTKYNAPDGTKKTN